MSSKIRLAVNFELLKESLRYGGKGYIGNVAQFLNYRLDIFLVAIFLAPAAVGFYALAVGMVERLWMIPGSIGTVLFPRVAAIDKTQANQLTPKVSRHTLFIVFMLSIVLLVLARPLIQLFFGTAFLPSVEPLMILLPGIVALSFAKVLSSDLAGRGRPEFGTLAVFASLAVNIPLNLLLIPKWGIAGAALASTVAYIIATLVVIIAFRSLSKASWRDILLIKKSDFKVYTDMSSRIIKMRFRKTKT